MKIAKNTVVQMHYTLRDDDGNILDTSREREPLEYIQGQSMIVPGLEKAMDGKDVGESFSVKVIPAEGYGEYDERFVSQVPRNVFQGVETLEVGMAFYAQTPNGTIPVRVIKVEGENVTIDANHELAGKNLNFEIEVVSVREATEKDLHHDCCCGGHGHCHEGEEAHECQCQKDGEHKHHKENCDGKGGCGCKHHHEHHQH